MRKLKKIFRSYRVWILIVFLFLSLVAIEPNPWQRGVAIRSVAKGSTADLAGIPNPKPTTSPMHRERILYINDIPIHNEQDYYRVVLGLPYNSTVIIKTNKNTYTLVTRPKYNITVLPELIPKVVHETVQKNITVNGSIKTINETINKTIYVNKTIKKIVGTEDIGLTVYNAPTSNLRKGLDLAGGTRVLLKPEEKLSPDTFDMLVSNLKERLNVYGLSDVVVRKASDLSGNQYILVEMAGVKKSEVQNLLAKQGKFEAKIGNKTVFTGGDDIRYVCRTPQCSGLDPSQGCGMTSDHKWVCRFRFTIALSPKAAKRQAELTKNLKVVPREGTAYLSKPLDLYLDNEKVDSLQIAADLKGRAVTDIQISGSGTGPTREAAVTDALTNMKRLQTILITGSLPTKLDIEQMTSISPTLGKEFIRNAIYLGFLAVSGVIAVVLLRYRDWRIAIPMLITLFSELFIVLGFAALIGWNLDLAAIAGLIIVIGTSVDSQIVITDEIKRGKTYTYSWKEKIKNAFFIIMGSYFTTVAAMFPLMRAGAGLLKGFAITTIIGVSVGVFITRPAFAAVAEILLKE